jgi:hypothetical protein
MPVASTSGLSSSRPLIRDDDGAVVVTTSVAKAKGLPGSSVYAATKVAVRSIGGDLGSPHCEQRRAKSRSAVSTSALTCCPPTRSWPTILLYPI